MNGEGVFTYANKDIYSGNWKNDLKDGKGTYVCNDTRMKYIGNWKAGFLEKGIWKFPNGTCYEGVFEKNKPKGKGKWVFGNGNIVEGEYNQIIDAKEVEVF